MLRLILLSVLLPSFSFAGQAPKKIASAPFKIKWGLQSDCERELGTPLRERMADDFSYPDEHSFYREISLNPDYSLLPATIRDSQTIRAGTSSPASAGDAFSQAGLRLDVDQKANLLILSQKKEKLFQWEFSEPISEVRFVPDTIAKRDRRAPGSGYLSVVGWSQTRYYRLRLFDRKVSRISEEEYRDAVSVWWADGTLPEAKDIRPKPLHQSLHYENQRLTIEFFESEGRKTVSIPATPALLEETGLQINWDRLLKNETYRSRMIEAFGALTVRRPARLPIDDPEQQYREAFRLAHLGEPRKGSTLLREALGELAEALIVSIQGPLRMKYRFDPGEYPQVLLRMAVQALHDDANLRTQFAASLSEHVSGMIASAAGEDSDHPEGPVGFVLSPGGLGPLFGITVAADAFEQQEFISIHRN
jgi:hypothetical protein